VLSNVILLKGYELWIVDNERHLLQEIGGSWAKYVYQISINSTTYHHSRFLIISPKFDSLSPRIGSFHTALLCTRLTSLTSKARPKHDAAYHSVYLDLNEIAHAQTPGLLTYDHGSRDHESVTSVFR